MLKVHRERHKAKKAVGPPPARSGAKRREHGAGGPARAEERGRWGATLDDLWRAAGPGA